MGQSPYTSPPQPQQKMQNPQHQARPPGYVSPQRHQLRDASGRFQSTNTTAAVSSAGVSMPHEYSSGAVYSGPMYEQAYQRVMHPQAYPGTGRMPRPSGVGFNPPPPQGVRMPMNAYQQQQQRQMAGGGGRGMMLQRGGGGMMMQQPQQQRGPIPGQPPQYQMGDPASMGMFDPQQQHMMQDQQQLMYDPQGQLQPPASSQQNMF